MRHSYVPNRPRGFTILEVILALAVMLVGFFTFFSVFSTSSHHAIQTQNRAAANMIAESYMDEFRAHTFGNPAPPTWVEDTDKPVRMVVKGRQTSFVFHKKIEYLTGAFVDATKSDNTDKITLTVTWKEPAGTNQASGAPTGHPEDNKLLRVEVPVWR